MGAYPASGCAAAASDVIVERLNDNVPRRLEPAPQIAPYGNAKLVAGLGQTQQGIATSLCVPAPTLRPVSWHRISFLEPLMWSGTSGRSSTISNSVLLACSRASSRTSATKEVDGLVETAFRLRQVNLLPVGFVMCHAGSLRRDGLARPERRPHVAVKFMLSPVGRKRCSATLGTCRRFRRFVGAPNSTASVRRCAFAASR